MCLALNILAPETPKQTGSFSCPPFVEPTFQLNIYTVRHLLGAEIFDQPRALLFFLWFKTDFVFMSEDLSYK